MAIEGLKNYFKVKKTENKKQKDTQIPEVRTEEQGSKVGRKIRNSAVGAALALASLVPMQSCMDQEQTMLPPDNTEFIELLKKIEKNQQQTNDLLMQIMKLLEQNNDQNAKYFEQLIEGNKQIMTVLTSISTDVDEIKETLNSIASIMMNMYENDEELLNKIEIIINGQGTDQEKLEQLIQLNQEQTDWLANIAKLLETIKDIDQQSSENMNNFFEQYFEGQKTHEDLMNAILAEIQNNGKISADILAKIDQIMNGDSADSVKLDQIIDLLASIDSKLGNLVEVVTNIGDNFVSQDGEKLADILKELLEKFEDHSITSNALAAEILNEIKQSNVNDEAILAKMDEILMQLQNNQITSDDALKQITALLEQMNNKMTTALKSLADISTKLDKLYTQNESNHDEMYDLWSDIHNDTNTKLDEIMKNQKTSNDISLDMLQNLDEIVAQLNQISTSTITLDQLRQMFGPMFDEIVAKLGDISNGQIDVDTIVEIAESMKPDLTVTNALLETINNTIQNKDFSGDFSAQLDELSGIMNEVLAEIQNGNMTEAEGLAEILSQLAQMEGSLDAIQAAAEEINNNFKTFMGEAQRYGQQWTEQFQQLINGQVNKEMFEAYTDLFTEKMEQAEQAQQERILAVIAAIENISGGNGSPVDIDELISKLPNYTDLLTEIRDAIGNLVTKDDLEQYGHDHSIDLTVTNALLETINATIQNKDFTISGSTGAGGSDLSAVIDAINRIYDNLSKSEFPTSKQIQQLLDYVNEIAANTSPNPESRSVALQAKNDQTKRELYAMVNKYNAMIAEKTGRPFVYYGTEFDYPGDMTLLG